MILSTCDLAPGDEETWDVPVPLRHLDVSCAIRVWDENHRLDKPVNTNAEVFIDLDDAGGLVLRGPDDR